MAYCTLMTPERSDPVDLGWVLSNKSRDVTIIYKSGFRFIGALIHQ
jgi:hypothetical protein